MEIFKLTLFFMLAFFVVIAIQVARNRRSTTWISFEGKEYWLLCAKLPASKTVHLIAYLDRPGFNFGPYIWAYVETDKDGKVISFTEDLDEF